MFEAGAIVWRIQAAGAAVFTQELKQADQAAKAVGQSSEEAGAKTQKLGKEQETAAVKAQRLAREQEVAARKARELAQAQEKVGAALVGIGLAVTAVTALTVKAAIDWETAWTGVTKTVDGTDEELAQLEGDLRALTKILPSTHAEIAAVAEAAGQLGVKREDVAAFTKTMIDLGETTNLSADEAATSLAQFMNIFQTAPQDVDRLGAAVVALGNDGASTERDIVQMSQRLAGAAKVIGLTEGETLGLANALASVGIEADAGGTSVSKIMIDIAQAVSQKGDKLLEWAKLAGISADEFAEKYRTKPAEAIALVIEGMGKLNAAGGDVFGTLDKLGQSDVRVTRALLGLANSGDLLRNSLTLGNKAWAENTALQVEAEKRYATTSAKLEMARNSVVDMAIDLGQTFLPVVQDAAEAVSGFANFIGGLPEPVQSAVAVTGALVGVAALLGGTMMLAVPKIAAYRAALAVLSADFPKLTGRAQAFASFLSGPWGIAIVAATAGIYALDQFLKSATATTAEFQNMLKNGASADELFKSKNAAVFSHYLSEAVDDVQKFQHAVDLLAEDKWFERGLSGQAQQLKSSLKEIGKDLGSLATSDLPAAQSGFRHLAESYDLTNEQQSLLLNNMPEYRDALIEQANKLGINVTSTDELANSAELLKLAQGNVAAATKTATEEYKAEAAQIEALEQELDSLLSMLNKQNDVGQKAITTNSDYQDALAEVAEYVEKARQGVEGYTATLDPNTAAGAANRAMLANLAADAWDAAEAQFKLDGNTAAFQARLEESRQSLIDRAMDLGATADEAAALADQVLKIPTKTEMQFIADTADAERKLQNLKNLTKNLTGASLTYASTYINGYADGGIRRDNVRFMADGGAPRLSHQQAQFRRAGSYVMWAEDETKGESFIPYAPEKRPQSTRILAQTASDFGYDLVPRGQGQAAADAAIMADGARSAGPQEIVGELRLVDGAAYITGVMKNEMR